MQLFLDADRLDNPMQPGVAASKKEQLIVEMPMHGSLHGRGADPDALPAGGLVGLLQDYLRTNSHRPD